MNKSEGFFGWLEGQVETKNWRYEILNQQHKSGTRKGAHIRITYKGRTVDCWPGANNVTHDLTDGWFYDGLTLTGLQRVIEGRPNENDIAKRRAPGMPSEGNIKRKRKAARDAGADFFSRHTTLKGLKAKIASELMDAYIAFEMGMKPIDCRIDDLEFKNLIRYRGIVDSMEWQDLLPWAREHEPKLAARIDKSINDSRKKSIQKHNQRR